MQQRAAPVANHHLANAGVIAAVVNLGQVRDVVAQLRGRRFAPVVAVGDNGGRPPSFAAPNCCFHKCHCWLSPQAVLRRISP